MPLPSKRLRPCCNKATTGQCCSSTKPETPRPPTFSQMFSKPGAPSPSLALRQASAEFLGFRGYTVLQARDGRHALSIAGNHRHTIDLAVTDVVMPRVSGGQLAKQLAQVHPETRVLFVSGYTGQTVIDHKVIDVEKRFFTEAFRPETVGGKSTRGSRPQLCRSCLATGKHIKNQCEQVCHFSIESAPHAR